MTSCFSISSSLSMACGEPSRPSKRSLAHALTFQPSPSPRPSFVLSKNCSRSSRQSWYPSARALAWADIDDLYSFVTDRAAARKTSSICSGVSLAIAVGFSAKKKRFALKDGDVRSLYDVSNRPQSSRWKLRRNRSGAEGRRGILLKAAPQWVACVGRVSGGPRPGWSLGNSLPKRVSL